MKEWLSGPGFISWLEDEFSFDQHGNGPVIERRALSLSKGENISVWAADRFLTNIGLHISLIPDDIWIERKPRATSRKKKVDVGEDVRGAAIQLHNEGVPARQLAKEFGVAERTVHGWIQKSRERAAQ